MRWLAHILAIALILSGFQPAQSAAMAAMTPTTPAITMDMGDHAAMMDHAAMGHDMAAMSAKNDHGKPADKSKSGEPLPCSVKMLPCCVGLLASLTDIAGPGLPQTHAGLRLLPALNPALAGLVVAPLPDPPRPLSV